MPNSLLAWQQSSQLCPWDPWSVPSGRDGPDHSLWLTTPRTALKFTFHLHFSLFGHCPGRSCGTNKVLGVGEGGKRAKPFAPGLQGTSSFAPTRSSPNKDSVFLFKLCPLHLPFLFRPLWLHCLAQNTLTPSSFIKLIYKKRAECHLWGPRSIKKCNTGCVPTQVPTLSQQNFNIL